MRGGQLVRCPSRVVCVPQGCIREVSVGETRPHAPSALAEGVGVSRQAQSKVSRGRKNGPARWPQRERPKGSWAWRPRGSPGSPQVDVSPRYQRTWALWRKFRPQLSIWAPPPHPDVAVGNLVKYSGSRLKILRGAWQQQTQILWEKFV